MQNEQTWHFLNWQSVNNFISTVQERLVVIVLGLSLTGGRPRPSSHQPQHPFVRLGFDIIFVSRFP